MAQSQEDSQLLDNDRTFQSTLMSQTQPEVNKLISDIFGSDDEDENDQEIISDPQAQKNTQKVKDDDDIFGSDDDENDSKPAETKIKRTPDDDIFGSDDSDDDTNAPQKLSRLHKAKTTTKRAPSNINQIQNKTAKHKLQEGSGKVKHNRDKSSKVPLQNSKGDKDMKMNDYSNDDAYDSGEEVKRTVDDDLFIDNEDDNADLLDEYAEDNENFDDEKPAYQKGVKRSRDDEEGSLRVTEAESDNPLMQTLQHMKKRKSEDLSEQHKTEIAQDLLFKMESAARDDLDLYRQGKPAINKLNMLKKVQRLSGVKGLQMTLLDFDFLGALKAWIEPRDKKTLPGLTIRSAVYELLRLMPCQGDHLKRSGIGKVLLMLGKHPMETPANKRLIKEVVDKWCRPIFGKSADIRSTDMDLDADGESRRPAPVAAVSTGSRQDSGSSRGQQGFGGRLLDPYSLTGRSPIDAGNPPVEPSARVRVPRTAGFAFTVRPESRVDKAAVREQTVGGSKGELLRRMKESRGGEKQNFRAETVVLSGRNKYLDCTSCKYLDCTSLAEYHERKPFNIDIEKFFKSKTPINFSYAQYSHSATPNIFGNATNIIASFGLQTPIQLHYMAFSKPNKSSSEKIIVPIHALSYLLGQQVVRFDQNNERLLVTNVTLINWERRRSRLQLFLHNYESSGCKKISSALPFKEFCRLDLTKIIKMNFSK
eukprot:gene5900-11910_t